MNTSQKRTKKGTVVSTKMNKTVTVAVDRYVTHSKYGKRYKITKKFYAHDENETAAEGNLVIIEETKPLSKLKKWVLKEVVA